MFFKIVGGGFTENHFLGVFDFLALMICSLYCILPPCILFFHYASFRSVGVRSISRGIITGIHWKYIHTIYIFDICSFSGKLFYHSFRDLLFLPVTEREWYEKTQTTQWRNHEHERISQTKLWETGHTPRSDCSYLPQLNLITPLSNMISSLDLIRLPCLLFLHYASFRSVGVRSINRGIVKVLHWNYIHTIYIFDSFSFSGKLFYYYICGTFVLPTTFHPPSNFCTRNIEFHSFNRLSLCIAITVVRFMLKWIEYTKHFMSQWLSIGLGLGEPHCDIKCFIYGICSNTNLTTAMAM
jgi:hypothetical protein